MQYFFQVKDQHNTVHTLAMVSLFSDPVQELFEESSGTLVVCQYRGQQALTVVDFKSIEAVVAMVPFSRFPGHNWFFLVEKLGLDVAKLGGYEEEDIDD